MAFAEQPPLPETDERPVLRGFDPDGFAARWPRVAARADVPARRTPIAEQAAARGEPAPVGSTAEELEARGYDVPHVVPRGAWFITEAEAASFHREGDPVDTTSVGRLTGYVWSASTAEFYTRALALGLPHHAEALRSLGDGEVLHFLRAASAGAVRNIRDQWGYFTTGHALPALPTRHEREGRAVYESERHERVLGRIAAELDRREAGYARAECT